MEITPTKHTPIFLLRCHLLARTPVAMLHRAVDTMARKTRGAPLYKQVMLKPQLLVGGQHYPRGWRIMHNWGVTAVVNMRSEFDDAAVGVSGDHYLHLPTRDGTPPTLDQLKQGVEFIANEVERGGIVYIHCGVGVGRAPTLAAAYLVRTGLKPLEAWLEIAKVRPFIFPRRTQIRLVDRYAETLQVSS